LVLCRLIDEPYTNGPLYGSRRMIVALRQAGYEVNRQRVQRLMRPMGLAGLAPGPNTRRPHPEHKGYPYRLRGVALEGPSHVWSTDITESRLARGVADRVAILDGYRRQVPAWALSNSLEAMFCVACLEEALRRYDKPSSFNTDQGSPITSEAFTGVLESAGVAIGMNGRGRQPL